jgi:germination protein M
MMKKDFHRKYDIFFVRKAVLVPVLFFLIIIFLFTFSCGVNSGPVTASANGASNDQTAEKQQDTEIDESADTSEESEDEESEEDIEEAQSGEITINVYYLDSMGEYLVGEARIVTSENKYVDALYELMKLPIDSSLYRLVPDSTKINSIVVEDGLAKVDFSKEFIEDRITSDTEDNLLIYSIVNTLTEFPEVNSVSFYIDGEKLDTLGELDVSGIFFKRNDLIKN